MSDKFEQLKAEYEEDKNYSDRPWEFWAAVVGQGTDSMEGFALEAKPSWGNNVYIRTARRSVYRRGMAAVYAIDSLHEKEPWALWESAWAAHRQPPTNSGFIPCSGPIDFYDMQFDFRRKSNAPVRYAFSPRIEYQTRCGYPVRIYAHHPEQEACAIGSYLKDGVHFPAAWDRIFRYWGSMIGNSLDLVPVNPPHLVARDTVLAVWNTPDGEKFYRHFKEVNSMGKVATYPEGKSSRTCTPEEVEEAPWWQYYVVVE